MTEPFKDRLRRIVILEQCRQEILVLSEDLFQDNLFIKMPPSRNIAGLRFEFQKSLKITINPIKHGVETLAILTKGNFP